VPGAAAGAAVSAFMAEGVDARVIGEVVSL